MPYTLTLTDLTGSPLEAGIDLELLDGGVPVAHARTTENGVAEFDLDDRPSRLSVRLDAEPHARPSTPSSTPE